jgi:hypothetical protein
MKIYKYGTAICCRVYFFHSNFLSLFLAISIFICILKRSSSLLIFFSRLHMHIEAAAVSSNGDSTYTIHDAPFLSSRPPLLLTTTIEKKSCSNVNVNHTERKGDHVQIMRLSELPFHLLSPSETHTLFFSNKKKSYFSFSIARTSCGGCCYAIIW